MEQRGKRLSGKSENVSVHLLLSDPRHTVKRWKLKRIRRAALSRDVLMTLIGYVLELGRVSFVFLLW